MKYRFRRFWRRHERDLKYAGLLVGAVALAAGGFFAAREITQSETTTAYLVSDRYVTVTHKIDGKTITAVEKRTVTLTDTSISTEPGGTRLVTVVRNGKTVTLELPPETVTNTHTTPGKTKTVTSTRTNTQTQTQTIDRPVTVTQTVTETHTETADPGTRTVTETETVTDTETVTRTETETQTVTETVTEAAP